MGDPLPQAGGSGVPVDGDISTAAALAPPSKPHYLPYRPPNSEFTPPASPQPLNPYALPAARKGSGAGKHKPANLHMESPTAPAYERPIYSPSPSSSPPLPPLPSPKFTSRQRAPSLLRHTAVSSPLNDGYPRAEQPATSPTFPPHMMRQTSGPGSTSDPRSIFNPLASNPVNQDAPSWEPLAEEASGAVPYQRMRGMTSSSQPGFHPHPPLRAATSIPDYGPIRGSDRTNLSGAYRPHRGGPNWSHNDHYPPRHFRGEEARASFRSGWTNASSSFMEASGTERSSMATGRSSISDHRASSYSRDLSDDRDQSSDTLPTSIAADDEDVMSTVEDVIDAYCYDHDDEEAREQDLIKESSRASQHSSSHAVDSGTGDNFSTSSHDADARSSHYSSEHAGQYNDRPVSHITESQEHTFRQSAEIRDNRFSGSRNAGLEPPQSQNLTITAHGLVDQQDGHISYLPPLQLSPLQLEYSPTKLVPEQPPIHEHNTTNNTWQRSSEEIPRQASRISRTSIIGVPNLSEQVKKPPQRPRISRNPSSDSPKLQQIHRDLSDLPKLPMNKARLSRQDWASIQAYAKRQSIAPNALGKSPEEPTKLALAGPSSPPNRSDPLPEVDEDEAFPRRASTSIFDRRSTLFELGKFQPSPPSKSKTTDFGKNAGLSKLRAAGRAAGMGRSVERDRYGFKKVTDKITLREYDLWFGKYDEYVSRRRNKWVALMGKNGFSTTDPTRFPDPSDKVKRYARKGYPPEWRGAMWWFYSGGQYKIQQADMAGLYASLVSRINEGELNKDDREAIERDLDRTFPDNIHFRPDPPIDGLDGEEQEEPSLIKDLREVLSCFALNNPGIGYCQSLNFIAGLLLLFLKQDRERVFVLLTIITQNHLPGAHARSLANTEVNVLMMLIRDYLPKVWASINDTDLVNSGPGSHAHPDSKFQRQPTVALSCTSWFMSLFVGVLPIETVLRVWDAFLYEGPRALYRYALAIFKLGEGEIRKYRPGDGELFIAVQNLPRRCLDPNVLHDIAFVKKGFGSLTQNVIDQKRLFWREQSEKAKRSASQRTAAAQKNGLLAVKAEAAEPEDEGKQRGLGGLRRKASRRFLKKKI